jgi:hypothetical protein
MVKMTDKQNLDSLILDIEIAIEILTKMLNLYKDVNIFDESTYPKLREEDKKTSLSTMQILDLKNIIDGWESEYGTSLGLAIFKYFDHITRNSFHYHIIED